MCRLVAWVSQEPRTLAETLGGTALARLRHLATVHADGWGAAWHDDDGDLVVQHSADSAAADEAFTAFSEGMASRSALVHLRLGTPGYGYGAASGHPFVEGPWAFAHNGAILPGSAVDAILPADSARRPHGPTDSERYFLAVREEMDRPDVGLAEAVDVVAGRIAAHGLSASSLNALVLGPDALHVVSRHDAGWQVADIPVWPADLPTPVPAYFPMACRVDADAVTVVSSGIVDAAVDAAPQWQDLPNDVVLTVDLASRQQTVAALRGAASEAGAQLAHD